MPSGERHGHFIPIFYFGGEQEKNDRGGLDLGVCLKWWEVFLVRTLGQVGDVYVKISCFPGIKEGTTRTS